MEQVGIYEQLISQVIEQNLDRKQFYVGERQLEPAEAATWIARFLGKLVAHAIDAIPQSKDRLSEQIDLANNLVLWLKDHFHNDELNHENRIKIRVQSSLCLT